MKIPGKMYPKKVSQTLINRRGIFALLTIGLPKVPFISKHFFAKVKVFCLLLFFPRAGGGGGGEEGGWG